MQNRRKTTEEFRAELEVNSPSIELLGEYINNRTKVKVRCKVCKNVYESAPTSLRRSGGCKFCKRELNTKRQTKTKQQFILELNEENPMWN